MRRANDVANNRNNSDVHNHRIMDCVECAISPVGDNFVRSKTRTNDRTADSGIAIFHALDNIAFL